MRRLVGLTGVAAVMAACVRGDSEVAKEIQPKAGSAEVAAPKTQPVLGAAAGGVKEPKPGVPAVRVTKEGTAVADVKAVRPEPNSNVRVGMVRIPSGSVTCSDPLNGVYELKLTEPFHMDATEVTWAQWREVRDWASTNGYDLHEAGSGKADDHPVQRVSWYECVKWCNARSEKEGLVPCYTVGAVPCRTGEGLPDCAFTVSGYRLPTQLEWEYAARGGVANTRFPWGDTISHAQANYYSSDKFDFDKSPSRGCHPKFKTGAYPYTSPVGFFEANGYGLFDMVGNVWEWCWAPKGSSRCIRGGSWDADAEGASCSYRNVHDGPHDRGDYGGFRTVRRAGQ